MNLRLRGKQPQLPKENTMFTTFDKAIAGLLGGLLSVLALLGLPLPEFLQNPEMVATVSGFISALLVYLVPNRHGGGGGP